MQRRKPIYICLFLSLYDFKVQTSYTYTSALESVSASLCLISLAIEKKTSSTFKFVFALCNSQASQHKKKEERKKNPTSQYKQQSLLTVSKNLIPYSSARA